MSSTGKRLILIDGSGFIFRAFYALPPMTRSDGTPVNAVYGFCNMLLRVLLDNKDADIAVIFDAKRKNFRHDIYPDYKGHRPAPPEALIPQFSLIHEACHAFNVTEVRIEGYEADDVIATYARLAVAQNRPTCIISGDKDLMQLIQPGIDLFDPLKNKRIDNNAVEEKFGVSPDKVIDVQALCGDASDNIPGVPGIGPKTAAELIIRFGTLENLLANIDQIAQPKRREALANNTDKAHISKQLVTLVDDVPVTDSLANFVWKAPEANTLRLFLENHSFKTLIKRVENEGWLKDASPSLFLDDTDGTSLHPDRPSVSAPATRTYFPITNLEDLYTLRDKIYAYGIVALNTETTSRDAMQASLIGLSFSVTSDTAYYIDVATSSPVPTGDLFNHVSLEKNTHGLSLQDIFSCLKPMFADSSIIKIGHNIKYDLLVLLRHDVVLKNVHDTMVMSYVLNGGKPNHNMDDITQGHLQKKALLFKEALALVKGAKTFADIPFDKRVHYACEEANITLQLYHSLLTELIEASMLNFYYRIERPLIPVLLAMEYKGITCDALILNSMSRLLEKQIAETETEIFTLSGMEFNVGSPKQVGEILFDKLALPSPQKGKVTTDAATLEDLAAQGITIAEKILHWRQVSKLKSTYTDALPNQINPHTGRVHTSFSMNITSTGRLSSSDPNLQNIPVRTQEGRKIRQAFVAAPGMSLISLDYSQIELRLLAHMAKIRTLCDAFNQGQDIHALTASMVLDIPLTAVTKELRSQAKAINFGIIYGISAFGLARQLKISRHEAQAYIDAYFARYPGIQGYMDTMIGCARTKGYVTTLFGRRCYTPSIASKNHSLRGFAERQAINAPLQGSNADIIKLAMIRIHALLQHEYPNSHTLLQVHDELIIEAPESLAQDVAIRCQQVMASVVKLSVPLVVDYGIGQNWCDIH
ncbi:MAG: DNA polymerase I [Alphaproteobacteria bacterium]|nr:MAG: DNA polymerase I [Alphaproteobacteria bacterium]